MKSRSNGHPLSSILFFLVSFPYLSIIDTPYDTQPYAMLFSVAILFLLLFNNQDLKISKMFFPFFVILLYAILRSISNFEGMSTLRSLVGYFSVPIIALASYKTFQYIKGKSFVVVVLIWTFFGFIQTFVSKSFGSIFIARMSTSIDRGVTSLAVEPSSYAIICIFFFILNDVFYARSSYSIKTYKTMFFLLLLQMLMSKSALGFLIFGVYLASKFIFNNGYTKKITSFLAFLVTAYIVFLLFTKIPVLQQTRVGDLLHKALINPMNLIYSDGSIAARLSHILVSFVSLFHSYGLGYGLGTWDYYALNIVNNSGQFIYDVAQVHFTLGRIMSAWGTAVFELGLIGLWFPISFISIMRNGIKKVDKKLMYIYKVSMVTIFVMMLMSVPIAFPLFGYMVGMFMYIQYEHNNIH